MKKVLIIGGSKGIGLALLNELIEDTFVYCINRTHIPFDHENFQQFNLDVLHAQLPHIDELDSLIYCPGSITLKPFNRLTESDFHADLEVNLFGAIKVIQHFLPVLKKSSFASVVLFSSVAVKMGMPFHTSIAVSKAAVEGLTKSLAAEYATKIRFNCIAPTLTNTPLASGILKNEQALENANQRHPLKTILEPVEVAQTIRFLISSTAAKITGQVFTLDCGLTSIKL